MGKKEKYGSYICKVGYLDIRQKIEMPRVRTLSNGDTQTMSGKIDIFIYHGKHPIGGPYKSRKEATLKAKQLIENNIKYEKHSKS